MTVGTQLKTEDCLITKSLAEILNDCSIDAIIAIDINFTIIAFNKTAEIMYGVLKKDAIGTSAFKVIKGLEQDDETVNAIRNAMKGLQTFVPSSKLCQHRRHAENHYIPLKNDDGDITGVMNIVHDVAHRIKAEQELERLNEELEKRYRQLKLTSDELASFTYITSNKIKEPIRQIYTGVEHLIKVEASRLSDSGKATFRRMQSSLNRMDLLLDDILSIAQISILEKSGTPVDLTNLLNEVKLEVEKKTDKNPTIIIEALCTIIGHPTYLFMLFYNLLNNAVKFNDGSNPLVKIICKKVVLNEDTFAFTNGEEYYQVTIADDGIGFEETDKERIFIVFEKLHPHKYKGSGIGLSIARKIMNAHDGFITVESSPGKGSSFHCFFPAT